ncbi:MAG: hypothetical protein ACODAQ_04370 [Phycisphaeraceae bacterium]
MDPQRWARLSCWLVALLGGALLAGACGGCEFKGGPDVAAPSGMEDYWRPVPVAMRIAPSTRFVRGQDGAILDARIELTDQMEDSVKSAGIARFDLFASDQGGQVLGRRLYHWNVTMRTLAAQREHFDPVTRTYLFRLQLDDEVATDEPAVLRVTFTRAIDGQRLQAQAPVR